MKQHSLSPHWLLITIMGLGLTLRLTGIGFGLPHIYHQDEPIIVHHALVMGVEGWNTHFFVIPPLTMELLFLAYAAMFVTGRLTHYWMNPDGFTITFFNDPSFFYLLGRFLLGALFGVAAIWAIGRLGEKHGSKATGVWAALILAVAPMHVQHSHYIYADIPLALAVILMLDRLLAIVQKPEVRHYLLFGVFLGGAVSIKYTALYFLPALFAAHILAHRRNVWGIEAMRGLLMAGMISAVTFAILAPGVILNAPEALGQILHQKGAESAVGWLHHGVYSLAEGIGWLPLAAALAGWLAFYRDREFRGKALVIAVFAGSYYTVNAVFSQHFARYMMPLAPVVALCAGETLARIVRRPLGGWRILLAAAIAGEMLVVSVYGDWLFLQKDTRTAATEWIQKNIPAGSAIAVDNRFFGPRLQQTSEQFIEKRKEIGSGPKFEIRKRRLYLEGKSDQGGARYKVYTLWPEDATDQPDFLSLKPMLRTTPQAIRDEGVEYLILNTTDQDPAIARLMGQLGSRGTATRIAVFNPYRDPARETPLDPHASTAAPHLRCELLARKTLGPYLEIFKLSRTEEAAG